MTTSPDAESPTREVLSFAHQLVIWLSLDSLEPFWMTLPPFAAHLQPIRDAARTALQKWHLHPETDLPESWFFATLSAALPADAVTGVRGFFDAAARLKANADLGYWRSWVSQNQHRPDVPGMAPDAATALMKMYRDDVVAKGNAVWEKVRVQIKSAPLTDWDMHIHAEYGLCTEETDQFDESMLLSGVSDLKNNLLFNNFLAQHVLTRPQHDQDCLAAAVRAEWADLWSDDPSALDLMLPDSRKTPEDAMRIRPAAEVVVWS